MAKTKKQLNQEYREKHSEEIKKAKHEYYLRNKDRIKRKTAEWYAAHPEKVQEKSRRQYYANHEVGKERRRKYRQEHLETERKRDRDRSIRLAAENREHFEVYFRDHPCVDCGETDTVVLEFDHVRGTKKYEISSRMRIRHWETLLEEIVKCEVRCANCHKRRHARLRKST